jgi:hypothetical protein
LIGDSETEGVQPLLIILLQITLTADLELNNFFANHPQKKKFFALCQPSKKREEDCHSL